MFVLILFFFFQVPTSHNTFCFARSHNTDQVCFSAIKLIYFQNNFLTNVLSKKFTDLLNKVIFFNENYKNKVISFKILFIENIVCKNIVKIFYNIFLIKQKYCKNIISQYIFTLQMECFYFSFSIFD